MGRCPEVSLKPPPDTVSRSIGPVPYGRYHRPRIPFRSINRIGAPGYISGMQRHHLVPLQALSAARYSGMIGVLGRARLGLDDFCCNGVLLPCTEIASGRFFLPLHRGPHSRYNELVFERLGNIEAKWQRARIIDGEGAANEALMRIGLLQGALRRRLLSPTRRPIKLNRKDPLGLGLDFADLDAMADLLWKETADVGR